MKFSEPLQSYCCPFQKNLPRKAELGWPGQGFVKKWNSDQLNTFGSLFFQISTDLKKKWAKSVQMVRVSFFRSDFLLNPYFSKYLWRDSLNFKVQNSRPLLIIIFISKMTILRLKVLVHLSNEFIVILLPHSSHHQSFIFLNWYYFKAHFSNTLNKFKFIIKPCIEHCQILNELKFKEPRFKLKWLRCHMGFVLILDAL